MPVVRAKDTTAVVSGSGAGVVDASASGLLDGTELIRYSADLGGGLRRTLRGADQVIVTDSNRDQAHRWSSSQDAVGFTESGGPDDDLLQPDSADARLPVFASTDPANQTIAVQQGPVTAVASSYGEPFAYRPEDRAVMAIDGDPTTAWRVADRFDAIGERILLSVGSGIDHVTLLQAPDGGRQRHITAIDLRIGDTAPTRVVLDDSSLRGAGQRIDIEPTTGPTEVEIRVAATQSPTPVPGPALAAVGFAEIDLGLAPTVEIVRPPTEVLDRLRAVRDRTPVSLLFTRLRHDPQDRFRADPEPGLERRFPLATSLDVEPDVTVRLDPRASDELLSEVLGVDGPIASDRLAGVPRAAAASAVDDDPTTSWISPFAYPDEHTLRIPLDPGESFDQFTVSQPGDEHEVLHHHRAEGRRRERELEGRGARAGRERAQHGGCCPRP